MSGRSLPLDVLLCVCQELASQQDFGTLFSCARTGKDLAGIALAELYRIHHLSPVISSEGNDAELTKNQGLALDDQILKRREMFEKWALQWKSVILSGLGQTLYPYGLYIRVLDLNNFADLLQEPSFRERSMNNFFAGDMAQYLKTRDTPMKRGKKKGAKAAYSTLSVPSILEAVGETITSYVSESASQRHSTVALETLLGDLNTTSLSKWTVRLSKLRSLTLWDGGALDASVATSIADHCFDFDDLTVYNVAEKDDATLASFFSSLRQNTLRSFTTMTAYGVGFETLLALDHHSASLKYLQLDGVTEVSFRNLNLIQGCTSIEVLDLTAHITAAFIDLKATENDVFTEVVAWLKRCTQLRELSVAGFVYSPSILTEVCLCNNIKLQKLVVVGYSMINNQNFHKSLSHQTSLEFLELKSDPEGGFRDDIDILISSITCLPKLKYLNLLETSDYFRTQDVISLTRQMNNLEELWFSGYDVGDSIWQSISSLQHLRVLNILALSSFSFNGIMAFISTLKDTNQGLALAVMKQAPTSPINELEQDIVRKAIEAKVGGTFELIPFREEDSESESDSD